MMRSSDFLFPCRCASRTSTSWKWLSVGCFIRRRRYSRGRNPGLLLLLHRFVLNKARLLALLQAAALVGSNAPPPPPSEFEYHIGPKGIAAISNAQTTLIVLNSLSFGLRTRRGRAKSCIVIRVGNRLAARFALPWDKNEPVSRRGFAFSSTKMTLVIAADGKM